MAKYLTVGASANIVLGDDKANVTINKTADLNSSGEVSIKSKNNLTDQKIGAVGQTSAGSSGENKSALINAAVNVFSVNSDSALIMNGGTVKGGSVEITADNIIADKRKDDIVKTVKNAYEEIVALTKSDTWSDFKDDIVAFKDSLAVAANYLFLKQNRKPRRPQSY